MNIQLQQIHIRNLRSIREATVRLWPFSVMFGKNDSGKSNLLLSLSLAFGNGNIDAQDVFSSLETPYDSRRSVIIDTKFIPIDDEGKQANIFNDLWGLHLGISAMTDDDDNQFFAFRTEFTYDADKEEYVRDRIIINEWRGSEIVLGGPLRYKTLTAFEFIYLDAQRDMSSDIRDKNSMWSKQISRLKLSDDAKAEIEGALGDLSDRIMEESPFLRQVSEDLTSATNTKNTSVAIDPVTRSVDELYKGLEIFISQNDSSLIPISNLGLGTRSQNRFAVDNEATKRLDRQTSFKPIQQYYCFR